MIGKLLAISCYINNSSMGDKLTKIKINQIYKEIESKLSYNTWKISSAGVNYN
jgi:hypothetical protein